MLDKAKKGVRRMLGQITGQQGRVAAQENLEKWQEKLKNAMTRINLAAIDEREQLYSGAHSVDRNLNATRGPSAVANNVRNVAYEMIESQVDTTIPMPTVKAKRRGLDFLAEMIEDSHQADILSELPMQKINDMMERVTPVQGQSYVLVSWNPDYTHREYVGELELTHIHPKQFIPQPGVYDVQQMDYFFILSSVTREFVKRRFDIDIDEDEQEEYPQIASLEYDEHTQSHDSASFQNEKVTLITCWYKDEDGEIGRICWVNDTLLEDSPKFFHRRQAVCRECGQVLPQGTEQCECGGKTKIEEMEYETLDHDLELEPLVYTKKRRTVQRDMLGKAIGVEESEEEVVEERIIPAGTQIPYYSPKRYPIAVRSNTPKAFSLSGMSDIDIIRDQQDSIKKVLTKVEGKILQGGSILTKLASTKLRVTNEDYQVLELDNIADKQAIDVITMQAQIAQDMAYYDDQYKAIQSTLGISDSFQGKKDTTATSGKAKEIQVQRAAGRLLSKVLNKYDFYRQLYSIMFEFKLAFYDEVRPFIRQNIDGSDDWGDFDKYQFLLQDAAGEWYYCTDFIFNSDSGQGIPNDKMWLYDQILALYQAQAIDLVMLWTILEQLKFPMAGMILAQIKERQEQAEEAEEAVAEQMLAEQQGIAVEQPQNQLQGLDALMANLSPEQQQEIAQIIGSMSPEAQQRFMSLPPEQMEEALMQAMQG